MMPIADSWGLRMLLLGIDSQFAYIEAVATVLMDAGIGEKWPRPLLSGAVPRNSRNDRGNCLGERCGKCLLVGGLEHVLLFRVDI